MSTQVKEGRNGNVVLTVMNAKGMVVFSETVKEYEVEKIVARYESIIR